jgi:glycosyltransferase involved in cell wall biosynthesis
LSKPRLNILQLLVSLPVGGAEDLVAAIVAGLDPEKFAVQAACIGPPGRIGQELAAAGYPVISLGLDIRHTSFRRILSAVRRLLKETRPDILHTHLYHANLYGRLAALGLDVKGVVVHVHNTYSRVKLHRRLANFLLARVTNQVLVGSPQVWQDVRRYDGVPVSRLGLLPNGINLGALETPLSREEAKAYFGVTGFCVGAVGRLEEQKGHTYLLEAVSLLKPEMGDLMVLLVGEGREQEALERQARQLGIDDSVLFLGTRRDLALIYRALDLYVQPSLWEGLSLAMLQAMGTGLPAVVSQVSGAVDIIQDNLNGRLVPPGNAQALAAAILELYRQPATRVRLGDMARRNVQEHYSQETMLRRLEGLYLKLGEKGRGVA